MCEYEENHRTSNMTTKLYQLIVNKLNNNVKVLGEYENNKTPILHYCSVHNLKFSKTPSSVLNKSSKNLHGKVCPACANNLKTTEMYKKELIELGIKIQCVDEYKSNKTKIKHYCPDHDFYWYAEPRSVKMFKKCPMCGKNGISLGELEIKKLLDKLKVDYKYQFKFESLRGRGGLPLSYDFAVIKNNSIKLLIEFDGEFHYTVTGFNNNLFKQLNHDSIKSEYAKKSKIKLIRIPYWDFKNIDTILNDELKKLRII